MTHKIKPDGIGFPCFKNSSKNFRVNPYFGTPNIFRKWIWSAGLQRLFYNNSFLNEFVDIKIVQKLLFTGTKLKSFNGKILSFEEHFDCNYSFADKIDVLKIIWGPNWGIIQKIDWNNISIDLFSNKICHPKNDLNLMNHIVIVRKQ